MSHIDKVTEFLPRMAAILSEVTGQVLARLGTELECKDDRIAAGLAFSMAGAISAGCAIRAMLPEPEWAAWYAQMQAMMVDRETAF